MTKTNQKVSIIIPVKKINDYILESVPKILELDYTNFEIIILPDQESDFSALQTTIIPTGSIGPGQKRDIGAQRATGQILAFIDDDAYPEKDWLNKALPHFENEDVAAVGGPAITPDDDKIRARTTGAVYTSKMGGGKFTYRYTPAKKIMTVDDLPSVNFIVRKDIFQKIGGFNSHYYPGEDTKLCLDIIKLGKKIIYDPEVLVYHHRRESIKLYIKQFWNYSIHRGHFAIKYPKTSFRLIYFIPTFFILFIIIGAIISIIKPLFLYLYISVLLIYLAGLIFTGITTSFREKSLLIGILVMPMIVLTHLVYGTGFIIGLFKKELKQ